MRIGLLGPLEVADTAGRPVEVGGSRLRTLLILLALDAGRVVTAERLADGVWGDTPPSGTANALQSLISRLRRAAPSLVIESHPSGYRLVLDGDGTLDVIEFDRLAARGQDLLADDPAGAADAFAEALRLWRGPALADVADADFARGHVSRLTERHLGVVEDHVEARLRLGRADVAELEALVTAHPLRERLRAQYMRALGAAGRQADALATFEDARRTLAEELGVDPSEELREAHLDVLRGAPTGPRPTARTNLRARLTSFIGREKELDRVGRLLEENRLVTLTGPGGAGKTRLAVESADRLADRMPGGVWLAELAPVGDAGEVPQALLAALGLREHALIGSMRGTAPASTDPVERLVAALAGERLLIVLDNCEHLIDACARLADRVLADCPGVRVLATSREALGITGETLWPVPPLAFPDPTIRAAGDVLDYPAVRLLAERGAAVRPGFTIDADLDAALAVCRRLDGMPLAIELAAARLRTMTIGQIAGRLDDRFRLLTGGSRTALPRHQTLRAVVDWSWDLLDEPEQVLLRRMSVFAGGATLESVEEVCGNDVFDALIGLVEKSLVIVDGAGRYRMLETIRAYSAGHLSQTGEARRVRRAHAHHFLALAETAEPLLRTRDQVEWLRRLDAEYDNLQSALHWAIDVSDTALAVRYVAALGWYWLMRGRRAEGEQLAAEAVALPGEGPAQARALACMYWTLGAFGNPGLDTPGRAALRAHLEAALEASRHLDPDGLHPVLRAAPVVLRFFDGQSDEALAGMEPLLTAPDPWLRATGRTMRAHGLINLGKVGEVEADFGAALKEFRVIGERWGQSLALAGLAEVALWRGETVRAKGYTEEALRLSLELGSHDDATFLRIRLAQAYSAVGDEEGARAELDTALRSARRRSAPEDLAIVRFTLGEFALRAGDLPAAREHLETAVDHHREGGPPQFGAMINSLLGLLHTLEGDTDAGFARHAEALRLAMAGFDAPVTGLALVGFADLAVRTGEPERAATLLGAAVAVRGTEDRSLADPPRIERAAREAIGDARFDAAYARGRAMNRESACAYAHAAGSRA
ncbi:BTAD domain-containing putative transcriptional regulator [Actinoallomurus iriomotensis]|uniref:SARP family transcriptional regulator n=1 Tax=Actinoallomurus iriomotensis TaxID=478107 RepID=A0A9W6W623_9ACTN|nr:BTAD domain-containing putative transcriptional regulator [Actinoallomurus iriomotensis]GLY90606.1 SARP family transcriptional regulator [Actinoallomurus iriomotensis]